jgi:hypothetical protein
MKKYFLGLLAIVFAVSAVAFTTVAKNSVKKQTIKEWRYDDQGAFRTAANYTDVTGNPPSCSSGSNPCVITIDEDLYAGSTSAEKFQTFLDGFASDGALLSATEVQTKP